MKSKTIRIILFIIAFVVGFWLLGYLIEREGLSKIIQTILDFGIIPFIGFVIISLINFGLYSYRWQLITNYKVQKSSRISFWKMYKHRMAGYAFAYLTPLAQFGGEPVRIGMLVGDGVDSKKATSSVTFDITLELIAYISFIIAGVVLALITGLSSANSLIAMGIVLIALLLVLTGFLFAIARGNGWFSRLFIFFKLNRFKAAKKVELWIKQTENIMSVLLHAKKSFLLTISILAVVAISFRVVEVFYIAYFFDVSLTFAQAFLISTLPGIALLLPVPGGLGLFEGGFASLFIILNVPLSAVAFAFIIRLRDLVFIFAGFTHLLRQGGKVVQDVVKKHAYVADKNRTRHS